MRVGFDARMIAHSGIGRYIENLLLTLPALGVELVAWMSPEAASDPRYNFPGIERRRFDAPLFSVQEQALGSLAELAKVDLLHVPHLNAPLIGKVPLLVTLHDLIPLVYRDTIRSGLGRLYFGSMVRLSSMRACRVLTVSEHSRGDLIGRLGVDAAKIRVTPPGVAARYGTASDWDALKSRLGIGDRYLLYAGQRKPYKNLGLLVETLVNLPGLQLVIVGRDEPSDLPERCRRAGVEDRVILTGYLEESELIALYHGAVAFVFPSRYEGFGLPPLEAMAAGTPVIASNASSIPEVVGDAGLLASPDSVLEWTQAVERLLADQALRQALSEAGRRRASQFTWETTARLTLACYEEALAPQG